MMTTRLAAVEHRKPRPGISPDSWMALAVAALGLLCYANTLRGEFVFDDLLLIVNNDIIKDPGNVSKVLFTNLWGLIGQKSNYYRPLPPLVFMLLNALFGMRPEPFHAVSIALHAGTTSLVFITTRALLDAAGTGPVRARWPAFAGAAIFAVHPIHTEAVAWISGVMDVSCAFFSLLAIYLYVTTDQAGRRAPREILSLGALLLGLLSKEPAAVVPSALVAHDLLFCRRRVGTLAGALRRWGPPFALLIAYLCLRSYVLGGFAPFRHEHQSTLKEVLLTVPRLFAYYIQVLVVPVGQNVLHHIEPVTSPTSPAFVWGLVILAAFAGLAWRTLRTGGVAAFGMLLFVVALAPSLFVTALGQDPSLVFAERYLYFPSVGAVMLLSAGLGAVADDTGWRRRVVTASLAAAIVVFSVMTVSRNAVWRDNLTLWSDCVRKSPNLGVARESLGLALLKRGQVEAGGRELQIALRLEPNVARRYLNYGVFAAEKGLLLQAIQSFQTALLYKPEFIEAHYSLAVAFEQMGWNSAAIEEYRRTLALKPDHPDAHNNFGILLAQTYRLDEAIDHFAAAVQSRPDDPELRLNLARAYDAKGLSREAQEQRSLAARAGAMRAR